MNFGCLFVCIVCAVVDTRPNIVWITCEDLSPRLGCYGDNTVATPNIDALAAQGVRYTNAYGVYGVCAPNRHCIIMGMYPTTTGGTHMRTWKRSSTNDAISKKAVASIPLYEAVPPPQAKCFPEYLRAAGYFCTNRKKTDYQFHPPVTVWDVSSKKAHWRQRPNDQTPFFSVFNFTVTHESGTFKKRSPEVTDPAKVPLPPYFPDTPTVRKDIARHYDNIAALDNQIAGIIQDLKDDKLLDKTIVFFFSDHGDGLPRSKRWVYDSGIKVPMIVRWPDGMSAGQTESRLVSFVDLAPTVLSLAGVEVPEHMHGKIFLGEVQQAPREYIYAIRDRMDSAAETIRAVRDKRYKYVRNYRPDLPYFGHVPYRNRAAVAREIIRLNDAGELGPNSWQLTGTTKPVEEFYDCQTDRHEIDNKIGSPELQPLIEKFRQAHQRFNNSHDDLGRISESELVKKLWPPDGVQPTTADPVIKVRKVASGQEMTISCATEGASIGYRVGDSKIWNLYSKPTVMAPAAITIRAHRIGYKPSNDVKRSLGDHE